MNLNIDNKNDFPAIEQAYRNIQKLVCQRDNVFALCEIEPTTHCTAACSFCPRHSLERQKGQLSLQDAEKMALNLTADEPHAIFLSGIGEPSTHPFLPEIVAIFKKHLKSIVGIVTNGSKLSEDLVKKLLAAKIDFFHVSVHGSTKETVQKISPGLDFDGANKNLRNLLRLSNNRSIVAINHVSTQANQKEKKEINRTWRELGAITVYNSPKHNRGGFLYKPEKEFNRQDCWIFTHTMFVSWEGKVLSCCHDLKGQNDYGNLKQDTLFQIQRQKAEMKKQTLQSSMCRSCDFFLTE